MKKKIVLILFCLSVIFLVYLYGFYPTERFDRIVFSIGGSSLVIHYLWMFYELLKSNMTNKIRWVLLFVFTFFIGSLMYCYSTYLSRKNNKISE